MTNFSGVARRMSALDIEQAAGKIGCEVAALRAVLAVESRGSGFDAKKRPIILFEPHVFWRNLTPNDQRLDAWRAGLAYEKWGTKPYAKTSDGNYDRLARAIAIDEECAYRAVSIGLGQVLGENYDAAGYPSARAMFAAATESEAAQLGQMIGFIEHNHLDDELRRKDWKGFARGYNGPGQVEKYSGLLAKAYQKWAKVAAVPREQTTAKELRASGSRTIAGADRAQQGVSGVVVTGGAAAGLEAAPAVLDKLQEAATALQSNVGVLEVLQTYWRPLAAITLIALMAYFVWRAWRGASLVKAARVDDAASGLNIGR
ncbi:N-acetylmuramidase family protein [Methylosinus sp. R-45379]|uniref:N-acetylmuramidase family protein n=1 Tax=Methylosinus sp. R-45379 TaxID=980563 RepID=UPI0007C895AE|nr:N-acetylmuramidase family protein [Methylosinus sp. R-45379]